MSLFIITPSYIDSEERAEFAASSLQSLCESMGNPYPHIVVDDYPGKKGLFKKKEIDERFSGLAEDIYSLDTITLIRRKGRGSTSAAIDALVEVERQGGEYVFIHLDDNVYVPELEKLLKHSVSALEQDSGLTYIKLAGYPVLWGGCTKEKGNLSTINVKTDVVSFGSFELTPTRCKDFTLWSQFFKPEMIGKSSYPVILWSTVWRVDALLKVLKQVDSAENATLAKVEQFYLNTGNFMKLIEDLPVKIGFINMQYGGIEVENNENWHELLTVPNEPVL